MGTFKDILAIQAFEAARAIGGIGNMEDMWDIGDIINICNIGYILEMDGGFFRGGGWRRRDWSRLAPVT